MRSFPDGNSDFTSYLSNATMYGAESQGIAIPVLGGDTLDSNVVAAAAKGTQM